MFSQKLIEIFVFKFCMGKQLKNIEHRGIVEQIHDENLIVKIIQHSACGSCKSKGHCTIADNSEKIIEVSSIENNKYKIGDEVIVTLEQNLGYKALLMGYMFPLFVLVASILIILELTNNEAVSALLAIGIMAIYYILLYSFKDKLKKTFTFRIKSY